MIESAIMAGFLTAHAVWSVSDGETLIPIYGYMNEKNERVMERLVHELLEDGVHTGQQKLEKNPYHTKSAVLIYDGRITLDIGKIDALIIEFREYGEPGGRFLMALPYTPGMGETTFAIHKPKVLDMSEHLKESYQQILECFFEGVDQHTKGAKVWEQHLDETI